ncbi:DNA repair protein REV1-like isoform X2 [Argiope bruennichi]|uniref:DNA repair protein REV1-like isoform X2 n=1 Tax=Argiope bruennichi TaxID=94029 RepID=UPI00249564D6|nr:DNA repair protein REV1-like isoform X2 [Argiope bruennichi]
MSSKQPGGLSKKKSKRTRHRESGFEEWGGYMAAKKQKLEMQFKEKKMLELIGVKETKIFEGIGIFVNGYTDPPADELRRLMLIHGGTYYHYPSSKITHIIASNLPKSKMKLLKTQIFVTADWITHSIKARKLLPYQDYLLYTPEVADKQQRLQIGNYFQRKSNFSSNTENHTVNEGNEPKKEIKNAFILEEDLESDFSTDYKPKAECSLVNKTSLHKNSSFITSYQKPVVNSHNKVSSPIKSSSNVNVPTSALIQTVSNKDSCTDSVKSSSIHENSHKMSSAYLSHQTKSTSNHDKVSPSIKSSSSVNISISAQNQSNPCKDSLHSEPSLSSSGSHAFNESNLPKKKNENTSLIEELFGDLESDSSTDSEQNVKTKLINKNSPSEKSSPNFSNQKHGIEKCNEVSSLIKSSSNVPVQSIINKDLSQVKSSSNINNVAHQNIPMNQSISNNETDSKPSKSENVSISPQKHSKSVKAGDPNFLGEFFNHSRKHHISTSAQELKRYVQFLVESNKEKHFPKRDRLRELARQFPHDSSFITSDAKSKARHIIMHLDMDCFFVSVGLRKHPELRGLPVAVTHSKGKRGGPQEGSDINFEASHYTNESKKKLKGVISGNEASKSSNLTPKVSIYSKEYGSLSEVACCSYEARKAGVRNGQFLGEALRRCPNLQTIPYDFEGYSEVSKKLYDIVASYTLDIEAVSCDELYIDCTELLQDVQLSPHQFASVLRAEIKRETGCTASAGMGSNMLLARLATKVAKPNGQHFVHDADVEKFMKQQNVGDLPGVGYVTAEKFRSSNIRTCEDMQKIPLSKLQQEFGPKTGQTFYNNCRGKDDRIVKYFKDRKSVSAEINYGIRFETEEDIYNFINELSIEVQNRIRKLNSKGKLVTLKLMVRKSDAPVETAKYMGHGICDHISQSTPLKSATDSSQVISKICCGIARSLKIKPQDYRGVGIQLSKLEPVEKDSKTKTNVLKPSTSESAAEIDSSYGVFAPKKLEEVNKVIPEKSTITRFLSNKLSLPKHSESTVENNPVKNISPVKQSESSSKNGQKVKTIEHFLSSKPSTSRAKSYSIADYLPEEIDLSVLEALPDDLKKEILESCKAKVMESDGKFLNQNASTSSANEQEESVKYLCQEQRNQEFRDEEDSNSTESDMIGIDQSFLNALPEDLKKEVLNNFISNKKHEYSAAASSQQPSTSFASVPNNSTKLDESVLNALPEDLRKEVLESYGLYPSCETHKPQSSASKQTESCSGHLSSKIHEPQPSTTKQIYSSTEQKSSKEESEVNSDEFSQEKIPTLGGVIELDDLRALIKEWMDSTDDPLEEDVKELKTFLIELCDFDLWKVEVLGKYFYRMAKKASLKWKDVYLNVFSSVQRKVMSIHNRCTLILSDEFPT